MMKHFFWLTPPDAANCIFALCLNDICYNIWSAILHLELKIKMSAHSSWCTSMGMTFLLLLNTICVVTGCLKSPTATVLDPNNIVNNHSAYLACLTDKNTLSFFFKQICSVAFKGYPLVSVFGAISLLCAATARRVIPLCCTPPRDPELSSSGASCGNRAEGILRNTDKDSH